MTCLEQLKKDYPDSWEERFRIGCPQHYGYIKDDYMPCVGRIESCDTCWNQECIIPDSDPTTPTTNRHKFKIFFGEHNTMSGKHADDKVNAWLDANPNIDILDFRYSESAGKSHSICITYEEVNEK